MDYAAPDTLQDALDLLQSSGARIVAGGTDWYPAQGETPVRGAILDITRITALRGITRTDSGWRIGAATTWSDIVRADLPAAFDALKAAAREVGSIQIQNAGTIAGNLCNASPAADGVPPLLVLDAQVELTGQSGQRILPLSGFVQGVRQTALQAGELVTAVHIPATPKGATSAFGKLGARRYLVISIAMVAAQVTQQDGRIQSARIAVGACSPVAQRLTALERDLQGVAITDLAAVIKPAHLAALSPISDVRGSGEYRLDAVVSLITRTLQEACHG